MDESKKINDDQNDLSNASSSINLRRDQKKTKFSNYEDESIHDVHKKMRDRAIEKRAKDKKNKKIDDAVFAKRDHLSFSYRFKRWWFGMGKESRRIAWATPKNLIISFLIVLFIVALLTALFYGINEIFISVGILKS